MSRLQQLARMLGRCRRWSRFNCADQNSPSWDERARAVVELCRRHPPPGEGDPRPFTVADLGCGNRRLEPMLEAALGRRCDYRGYDLCPQSPRTVRVDLQRELPPGVVDVAVAAGVLEYLSDVPAFLTRLCRFAAVAVVSYVIFDSPEPLSRREREERGWRSHYSREQLDGLLVAAGFRVTDSVPVNRGRTVVWLATRADRAV